MIGDEEAKEGLFIDPADDAGSMFPTGNLVDELDVPEAIVPGGKLKATLINAGIPTIFVNAAAIGYNGTELRDAINGDAAALECFERLRTIGALRMGLIKSPEEAAKRQHTPKIAFVAPPAFDNPVPAPVPPTKNTDAL